MVARALLATLVTGRPLPEGAVADPTLRTVLGVLLALGILLFFTVLLSYRLARAYRRMHLAKLQLRFANPASFAQGLQKFAAQAGLVEGRDGQGRRLLQQPKYRALLGVNDVLVESAGAESANLVGPAMFLRRLAAQFPGARFLTNPDDAGRAATVLRLSLLALAVVVAVGAGLGYLAPKVGPAMTVDKTSALRPGDVNYPVYLTPQEAAEGKQLELSLPGRAQLVRVKIPKGVTSGTRLRLRGQGEAGQTGAPAGDLYLVISVR
jgi:hypothetical protein